MERREEEEGRVMMLWEDKGGRTVCSEVRERESKRGEKRKRHQERERQGGHGNCL